MLTRWWLTVLVVISACSAAPTAREPLSEAAVRSCVLNPDRMFDSYDSSEAPRIGGNDLQALYLMVTNLTDDSEMLGPSPPSQLGSMEPLSAEQVVAVRAASSAAFEDSAR